LRQAYDYWQDQPGSYCWSSGEERRRRATVRAAAESERASEAVSALRHYCLRLCSRRRSLSVRQLWSSTPRPFLRNLWAEEAPRQVAVVIAVRWPKLCRLSTHYLTCATSLPPRDWFHSGLLGERSRGVAHPSLPACEECFVPTDRSIEAASVWSVGSPPTLRACGATLGIRDRTESGVTITEVKKGSLH